MDSSVTIDDSIYYVELESVLVAFIVCTTEGRLRVVAESALSTSQANQDTSCIRPPIL